MTQTCAPTRTIIVLKLVAIITQGTEDITQPEHYELSHLLFSLEAIIQILKIPMIHIEIDLPQ